MEGVPWHITVARQLKDGVLIFEIIHSFIGRLLQDMEMVLKTIIPKFLKKKIFAKMFAFRSLAKNSKLFAFFIFAKKLAKCEQTFWIFSRNFSFAANHCVRSGFYFAHRITRYVKHCLDLNLFFNKQQYCLKKTIFFTFEFFFELLKLMGWRWSFCCSTLWSLLRYTGRYCRVPR